MQQEKPFTETDSLALIESMINTAKNQFSENGHLYLLWGWVILVCSVGQFVLIEMVHYDKSYFIWFLPWLAFIYQAIYMVRHKRKRRVKTYTDGIIGYVWLSFIISMFLVGFIVGSSQEGESYKSVYPLFLTLYGIPIFLSGIIVSFRPLIIGGISCWLLAVTAMFVPSKYHLLLIGLAMIIAWIVPGYLLNRKYNDQMHTYGKKLH